MKLRVYNKTTDQEGGARGFPLEYRGGSDRVSLGEKVTLSIGEGSQARGDSQWIPRDKKKKSRGWVATLSLQTFGR